MYLRFCTFLQEKVPSDITGQKEAVARICPNNKGSSITQHLGFSSSVYIWELRCSYIPNYGGIHVYIEEDQI